MARRRRSGKFYAKFIILEEGAEASARGRRESDGCFMVPLAATMFVGLFGFGAAYFGWSDPEGKVQLALFTTFVLGIVCGYKTKG